MASSVTTYMHALRGLFRFAHIDGLIVSDPPSTRGSAASGPLVSMGGAATTTRTHRQSARERHPGGWTGPVCQDHGWLRWR
jgi:hypothetical protein